MGTEVSVLAPDGLSVSRLWVAAGHSLFLTWPDLGRYPVQLPPDAIINLCNGHNPCAEGQPTLRQVHEQHGLLDCAGDVFALVGLEKCDGRLTFD